MLRCEAPVYGTAHFDQNFSRQTGALVLLATSFSVFSFRGIKTFQCPYEKQIRAAQLIMVLLRGSAVTVRALAAFALF